MKLKIDEEITVCKWSFLKKHRKTLKGIIKSITETEDCDIVGNWSDYDITVELENGQLIQVEGTTACATLFPKYRIIKKCNVVAQ
ncbi:MAG TPA: hypothetical protein VIM42_11085 [Clostridium sp.]